MRRPIAPVAFLREFRALVRHVERRAGFRFPNYSVVFLRALHVTHCRNARRFAQVVIRTRRFEFAPEILFLPKQLRQGLCMHEIGHVLAGPRGTEADADAAAAAWFGVKIGYERRGFPGKGVQRAKRRRR